MLTSDGGTQRIVLPVERGGFTRRRLSDQADERISWHCGSKKAHDGQLRCFRSGIKALSRAELSARLASVNSSGPRRLWCCRHTHTTITSRLSCYRQRPQHVSNAICFAKPLLQRPPWYSGYHGNHPPERHPYSVRMS